MKDCLIHIMTTSLNHPVLETEKGGPSIIQCQRQTHTYTSQMGVTKWHLRHTIEEDRQTVKLHSHNVHMYPLNNFTFTYFKCCCFCSLKFTEFCLVLLSRLNFIYLAKLWRIWDTEKASKSIFQLKLTETFVDCKIVLCQ